MDWEMRLNAKFAKWFNSLEGNAQDETLATLSLLREIGPEVMQRRLESIQSWAADASNNEKPKVRFQQTTLTEYLERLPEARRRKIETRAAEIRAEELHTK